MPEPPERATYASPIRFEDARIRAMAVYCSDGRFGEHVDDFLHTALRLPRYDRLAVPGGAACLAGHFGAYREEEGVAQQLRFLLSVHDVRRVVLIAHEGCAYYTHWLNVSALQRESRQREDLVKAVRLVRRFGTDVDVEAYFARQNADRVAFERISV